MPVRHLSIALSCTCLGFIASYARADEPTKPTASASSTNPAQPAAGHSIHGEAFDDGPRSHAELVPGQGKVDFPVSTTNKQAQAFITQGVAQLHTFYYFEAERSFRQAAKLDPGCPMAYWGLAMANINNPKRAKGFLKEAQAKAKVRKPSRREELYLDSLEALYKDGKAQKANHLLGLETIVQEFPGDLDARAWMAMVAWQNAGSDGIGSRQAVDTVLESILEKEPLHPGAIHYRIHLWDGYKPLRAEKAATIYAKAAPGIAHAWHMPGHIFTGLKRYGDAAYQQEGSARADHAAMFRDRVMPFEIHNYSHNNQWLSTSLSHAGRAKDSIFVARNLVEQPRDPNKNGPNDGGSSQRSGRIRWVEALTRYELWDDLIQAVETESIDFGTSPMEKVQKAHALGLAYAAKGNSAKLLEQINALKALVSPAPAAPPLAEITAKAAATPKAAPTPRPSFNRGDNGAASALAELEGLRLLAAGEHMGAIEQFGKASAMRPEALARYHLLAKNFGLAETAARQAVEKQPEQFPPLATYVEVLSLVGKTKDAQTQYRKLEQIGRDADRDTPVMKRLASIVAAWKASDAWKPAPEAGTAETLPLYRTDFEALGPLGWTPNVAPPFRLVDADAKPYVLADHKGRNVVVLFYLGNKCPHCLQQLQVFGKELKALGALNTDVVAISTDTPEKTRELKANAEGVKFPMPILPDPGFKVFKDFRAFDEFEDTPLHGTFLIDAKGLVRFQRISAEPFLDVDFIKTEAARMNRLNR